MKQFLSTFKIYKLHPRLAGYVLHRLSGLCLTFYLFMHLYVLFNLTKGADAFNKVMEMVQNPFFKILEAGLLGVAMYHTFHGLAVCIYELGLKSNVHKTLYWIAVAVFVVITAVGGGYMIYGGFMHL